MRNQQQGKRFELMVERVANELRPDLVVKRIERSRFDSTYDIEFQDFPHYKVDCKSSTTFFSFVDLYKLLKTCQKKYCSEKGDIPIIIFGEKRGKTKIMAQGIGVAVLYKSGVITMPFTDWLRRLTV